MLDRMRPAGYAIELTENEQDHFNLPGGWKSVLDNDEWPFKTHREANAKLMEERIARTLRRNKEK